MNIIIRNSDKRPIYEQIKDQIKEQIILGELKPGEKLPSIRLLAKELLISVITTKRAYDDLENEGLIQTVQGKGTYVADRNIEFIREEGIKEIEKLLIEILDKAKLLNISKEELVEILDSLDKEV